MTALRELIALLPPNFTPVFAPRLNKLFYFIKENSQLNERSASEKYLGNVKRIKYFNKLKNELKEALTKYLIAYSTEDSHPYKAAHEECYRNFSIYKILLGKGKRKAAISIAKNLLPKLQKFEIHSLAHTAANDLLFHYSSIEISPGLINRYQKIATSQLKNIEIESLVRRHYSWVGYICNTRESFTPTIIANFERAVNQIIPLLKIGSNHINRLIYSIVICRYLAIYDYDNILKYCNEAIGSFPLDHPNYNSFIFTFLHHKITALTASSKFGEAKTAAKKATKLVPKGSFNWHLVLIKRTIVCFHSMSYQEAYELYKAATKENCPSPILIEYWRIIRGYLYFLIKQNKIQPYAKERFYLGKFLNEVPIYSRDKAGNNINILIIQILIQIQRNQFGKVIDYTESLREYARKYTRNPETKRANTFIKMILKMEAASFHRVATERKTQKLCEKLSNTPIRIGQNLAVEIVPYEVLWQELLTLLDNKFKTMTTKTQSTNQ